MKINLDFFNKSTGLVLVFASLIISVIAFAGTLNINGDVNSTGSVKQGGNILVPSGAVMAFELSACPAGWTSYSVLPGYSLVQGMAGYNIGTTTDGSVKSHNHTAFLGQGNHDDDAPGRGYSYVRDGINTTTGSTGKQC